MTFDSATTPDQRQRFIDIWALLQSAPMRRRDAFRTPTIATVAEDGTPQNRTVVLRAVDATNRRLTIYSDGAAEKCTALRQNNRAAFCFWNAKKRIQVRMTGTATLSEGDQVSDDWLRQSPQAQSLYRVKPLPGQPIDSPSELSYDGDHRFVRVDTLVSQIDVLWLLKSGHERLHAQWSVDRWTLNWTVP